MDETRFDALTRTLSSLAGRRTTVRVLSGAAISALAVGAGMVDARKKKKCKGGRKKCGRKCCPLGQFCRGGTCSFCPRPLRLCPDGGCAKTLCGGRCCAVAETCVDNQCEPCPALADSCAADRPRCNNGAGFCATSVEGGNFCVSASRTCQQCIDNDDCADVDDFAICAACTECAGTKACLLPLPE